MGGQQKKRRQEDRTVRAERDIASQSRWQSVTQLVAQLVVFQNQHAATHEEQTAVDFAKLQITRTIGTLERVGSFGQFSFCNQLYGFLACCGSRCHCSCLVVVTNNRAWPLSGLVGLVNVQRGEKGERVAFESN